MIDTREREILQRLHSAGPMSRWELHELTGQTPNRVGLVVEGLVKQKLLRERDPEPQRAGRPRIPLEIDPGGRHFIGLAIAPGTIDACRLGLTGVVLERIKSPRISDASKVVQAAAELLKNAVDEQTFGVGVTVTGFIDTQSRTLLLSSATPGQKPASLKPLDRAVGGTPLILGNDMHALAARWSLQQATNREEDVLLVWFDDGRMGSAFLSGGRPSRGVLAGGNELGHTRFFVETDRCFCGHVGCLERIVSSEFLHRQTRSRHSLAEQIAEYQPGDSGLRDMLRYFCGGIANVVNFLRPHRVVVVSPMMHHEAFRDAVFGGTRELLLDPLKKVVAMDFWDQPSAESADNAAWLALAELLWTGWGRKRDRPAGGAEMNGFVDLQVNGYGGVDFNSDDLSADALHRACELLQKHGVSQILATVITEDLGVMGKRLARLTELREKDELARNLIGGFHIEGPFINETPGFKGAHPADAIRPADLDGMKRLLDSASGLTKLVTLAPERDAQLRVTSYLSSQHILVSAGHCDPTIDQLSAACDAGLSLFTHVGNGCPMQMHRHDNIVQRVLSLSDRLTLCFIADGVHIPLFALKNYLKCAGLDRCLVVTDAIAAAGLGPGRYKLSRWEVAIGEDLAARAPDGSHLVGSAMTMPQNAENLAKLGLTESDIRRLLVDNPQRVLEGMS